MFKKIIMKRKTLWKGALIGLLVGVVLDFIWAIAAAIFVLYWTGHGRTISESLDVFLNAMIYIILGGSVVVGAYLSRFKRD